VIGRIASLKRGSPQMMNRRDARRALTGVLAKLYDFKGAIVLGLARGGV
jgi:predicted phosphoribosyltransferase